MSIWLTPLLRTAMAHQRMLMVQLLSFALMKLFCHVHMDWYVFNWLSGLRSDEPKQYCGKHCRRGN